jgi:hypothetical protein
MYSIYCVGKGVLGVVGADGMYASVSVIGEFVNLPQALQPRTYPEFMREPAKAHSKPRCYQATDSLLDRLYKRVQLEQELVVKEGGEVVLDPEMQRAGCTREHRREAKEALDEYCKGILDFNGMLQKAAAGKLHEEEDKERKLVNKRNIQRAMKLKFLSGILMYERLRTSSNI